jgi:hypothetical protein
VTRRPVARGQRVRHRVDPRALGGEGHDRGEDQRRGVIGGKGGNHAPGEADGEQQAQGRAAAGAQRETGHRLEHASLVRETGDRHEAGEEEEHVPVAGDGGQGVACVRETEQDHDHRSSDG